ncbi:MAG: aryl-sulfate sulfotransferase [Deltaproteobacteria bacterium]|nr:aryl-sulfate sulfotransferase [Deltaproteobacteria bacterium]
MKRIVLLLITTFMLLIPVGSVMAVHIIYSPTGVMHYDKDLAFHGYTFIGGNVIDMEGNLIFSRETLGGGVILQSGQSVGLRMGKDKKNDPPSIVGVDIDGDTAWQWKSPAVETHYLHHDFEVIWNKKLKKHTVIAVARHNISKEEAVAAGSDPDNRGSGSADAIIEIDISIPQDPNNPTNNVIWQWRFWDHIVQYYKKDGKLPSGRSTFGNSKNPEDDYGRLDVNVDTNQKGSGFTNDWNHVNGIGYHPERDEIIMSARENSELFVIDHSLTTKEAAGPKGDFTYRWGNPYNYSKLKEDRANLRGNGKQQTFGQHRVYWIEKGLPGAGEILFFENGSYRPQFTAHSAIYQVNPYDKDGNYVREKDAGYTDSRGSYGNMSNQITWAWSASEFDKFNNGFYSSHGSSCQRLPNGNTLISCSEGGHLIEVTMDKKVAWEYISPFTRGGKMVDRLTPEMQNSSGGSRYAPDDPRVAETLKRAYKKSGIKPAPGYVDEGGGY